MPHATGLRGRVLDRPGRVALVVVALGVVTAGCGSSGPAKSGKQSAPVTVPTARAHPPTGPSPTTAAATAGTTAWPEALHDNRHSGASTAVGPTSAATIWTRKLGGQITAGAIVGRDGTIYDSADNGVLHALDPSTGADRWTFDGHGSTDNNEDLSVSPVVLADGTIVWPGPHSTLDAISPAGTLVWTKKLAGTVLSPAVTPDGDIVVADSAGEVAEYRPQGAGAQELWRIDVAAAGFSFGSPAVGSDGAIYVTSGRELIALTASGSHVRVKWRFTAKAAIEVSASVGPDGTVILGTNDPYEYGISPTGKVVWRYLRKAYSFSTPAVTADGLAYFGGNDGDVDVVRASTGQFVGRYDGATKAISAMGIGVWTAPLVDARHHVYFGTASGHILGFGYNGQRLFDIPTGAVVASYPTLTADGTLLVGSDNGTLYAIHG